MKGGNIDIPKHNDDTTTASELAVKQQNDVELQLNKKGLAGGARKKRKTKKRFRQIGGEKFICPQSANASAKGNEVMCQSAELLATTQQNSKYNDTSGQQGGRKRKTKKLKKKHRKKTRKYKKTYKNRNKKKIKKSKKRYRKRN